MADRIVADVAVIGAGIAGAGVAAELARDFRVVMIEREDRPGHHSTGRSAALFIPNYGNGVIRALNRASGPLFHGAASDLFPHPLLTDRGLLYVADPDGVGAHRELLAESEGIQEISVDEALAMVPILRRDGIVEASFEEDAHDIDVAALHQGWLKAAKQGGAVLYTQCEVISGERRDGQWLIKTSQGEVFANIVVNAAGAWGDIVAKACGLEPIGLQPLRRSMAVLPGPAGYDIRRWPSFNDARERWYAKPDGGRLFVSPADEDPVDPHDAYPDDMVLAEGLDRFQQLVNYEVTHLERSWAGLRTFAPDHTPVAGFDRTAEGFFWLAGQGGYGIQTSPALSLLAGQLIRQAEPSAELGAIVPALSPNRFRA
ncbi:FAD-binding oxidoreductase [Pseudaminobacter sp. 19-2017]|uniref:FAD-binding oxidoreductase n=1 Tax=Pseudaminobacter soli (ex Zhang et al. 2022) TaxID=2831468 RepID=A0A942I380_9HYPH|nr:FAD-binding oxidoreductase [Pseudaminobacter soli]MBS3649534.1 FAD-binding oxidoreductase [Pseudaminobacter soli]